MNQNQTRDPSGHTPKPLLYIACILISVALLASLFACAMGQDSSSDPPSDTSAESEPSPSPDAEESETASNSSADLLSYYVSLVEDLQEEVRKLKAENFILSSSLDRTETEGDTDASVAPALPYTYERDDGEITILSYTGSDRDLEIPAMIDECPVTKIGEGAFAKTNIRSVILPDSVEEIDWFAFRDCASLQTVKVGNALSEIEYGAFEGCSSSLTLICPAGSYAARYGQSFGIAVKYS